MPTALEVGIVETKEQDELFKKLVGDNIAILLCIRRMCFIRN